MFKAAILTAAITLLCGCEMNGRQVGPSEHDAKSVELGKFESARLEVKMDAGELRLSGGSAKLAESDVDYNVPSWKPRFITHISGLRADVRIEQPTNGEFLGDVQYKWGVRLNDQVPWDIVTNLGAGEAHLDL